jgi:hypothetical protein
VAAPAPPAVLPRHVGAGHSLVQVDGAGLGQVAAQVLVAAPRRVAVARRLLESYQQHG